MHIPQIVADLKYRRKIAEKVFSVNLRAFDQRILRGKDNFFSRPNLNYFYPVPTFLRMSGSKGDDARIFLPYVHMVEG